MEAETDRPTTEGLGAAATAGGRPAGRGTVVVGVGIGQAGWLVREGMPEWLPVLPQGRFYPQSSRKYTGPQSEGLP